jgi:hypothetical protein
MILKETIMKFWLTSLGWAALAVVHCQTPGQDESPRPQERFLRTSELLKALDSKTPDERRKAYETFQKELDYLFEKLLARVSQDKQGNEEWEDKEIAILLLRRLAVGGSAEEIAVLAENLAYHTVTIREGPDALLRAWPAADTLCAFGQDGLDRGVFWRVEFAEKLDELELKVMARVLNVVFGYTEEGAKLARTEVESRKTEAKKDETKKRYDRLLELLK